MSTLYVLELEDGKYYIGKTDDVQKRLEQHLNGRGSAWTKKYSPNRIVEQRPITSVYDETNVTKDYMKKYGIDNVRGGAYCNVDLTEEQEDSIRHELRSATDNCYKCGKPGHFANRCPKKSSFTGTCGCGKKFMIVEEFLSHNRMCIQHNLKEKEEETWECDYCDRIFDTKYGAIVHERTCKSKSKGTKFETGKCYRCGRSGHYATSCYARTHVEGYRLDSDDSEYESE